MWAGCSGAGAHPGDGQVEAGDLHEVPDAEAALGIIEKRNKDKAAMKLHELIRRLLEVEDKAERQWVYVGNMRVEQVIKMDSQRVLIIPEDPFKEN